MGSSGSKAAKPNKGGRTTPTKGRRSGQLGCFSFSRRRTKTRAAERSDDEERSDDGLTEAYVVVKAIDGTTHTVPSSKAAGYANDGDGGGARLQ